MKKNVLIATDNLFLTNNAKTAHGLLRGSNRFHVLAVLDEENKDADAGQLLDGSHRNIPVLGTVDEAIKQFKQCKVRNSCSPSCGYKYLIIGNQNLISTVYNYFHLALYRHRIQIKLPVRNHPMLTYFHQMCTYLHLEFYLWHLMH